MALAWVNGFERFGDEGDVTRLVVSCDEVITVVLELSTLSAALEGARVIWVAAG